MLAKIVTKLKALWASLWSRVLSIKSWLSGKSYSFTISGLHVAYVAAACVLVLGVAFETGKWDGQFSKKNVSRVMGFVMPAADPPKEQIEADLEQCIVSANSWKDEADKLKAAAKQDKSAVKAVVAPLPTLAPATCVAGKTVVRYYKARSATVLQDLGLTK